AVYETETGRPVGEPLRFEEDVTRAMTTELGVAAVAGKEVSLMIAGPKEPARHSFKREAPITHCWLLPPGRPQSVTTIAGSGLRVWSCPTKQDLGKPVKLDGEVLAAEVNGYSDHIATTTKFYTWTGGIAGTPPRELAFPARVKQFDRVSLSQATRYA